MQKALIVGLGSIGVRHLNNLHSLGIGEFYVFRKRNIDPPSKIEADKVEVFTDLNKALQKKPELAVISNPTALHLPAAVEAAQAGCHIYMEKPISHSFDGVAEFQTAIEKGKRVVQIGCQLRFHKHLEIIKTWLQEKRLGKLFSVSVEVGEYLPGWHPWEDYRNGYAARSEMGGGVILTLIHELDYIYWLFGEIDSVYVIGGKLTTLDLDVEDTVCMLLKSKKNILIQLRMDYWRKPAKRSMNIVGEHGEIFWDYTQGTVSLWDREKELESHRLDNSWERNVMFRRLMSDFLGAIRYNTTPRIPLKDGVAVLKLALAAKESLINGQEISM